MKTYGYSSVFATAGLTALQIAKQALGRAQDLVAACPEVALDTLVVREFTKSDGTHWLDVMTPEAAALHDRLPA